MSVIETVTNFKNKDISKNSTEVFALHGKKYEYTKVKKKKKENINSRKELFPETARKIRDSRKRANSRARVYHTGKNTRVSHYDVQRAHARPTHNSIVEGIPCLLEDLASS